MRICLLAARAAFLATAGMAISLPTNASAQTTPTPSTLVSVCSGVSLPRSVVTDIIDPVVTGIYGPIETSLNGLLLVVDPLTGLLLPSPLSVDVNGLLTSAAAGDDIGLAVVAADGTLVGPSDQCDATADSFTLDNPAGIAIGGNQITGLGDTGEQANAGEIDSVAIGNRASTDPTAIGAIALGVDASVGAGAVGGIAIGDGASVTADNSVAIGANSVADRADSVSVGAVGAERQIVNVAAGAVNATSTDAINGSQLFDVQQQVDNLDVRVTNNTTAITNLSLQISNGSLGPVQYSNPATPTVPNGGVPTNDVTLVGAAPGPVGLHNVADGLIAAGSTDAVNGGQIFDMFDALPDSIANAVTYDNDTRTTVTLNSGGTAVNVRNVAPGVAGTDAVNVNQLNSVAATTLFNANAYTDLQFNLLDRRIDRNRSDARAGTAGALAAAGLPQANGVGRTMIAGGIGAYGGQMGFAVGASHRTDSGQATFKVGLTYDSSRTVGANAGVGFEF
jgi:autotransporter adhesin